MNIMFIDITKTLMNIVSMSVDIIFINVLIIEMWSWNIVVVTMITAIPRLQRLL